MKPDPADLTWQATVNGQPGLDETLDVIRAMYDLHGYIEVSMKFGKKKAGSQSMLNTWMKWMEETAIWMAWNGAKMPLVIKDGNPWGERAFEQRDAHALFTRQYLGVDANGKRKTWKRCEPESDEVQASTGDRLHAMDCHIQWASERGLSLTIPASGEYQKLKDAACA